MKRKWMDKKMRKIVRSSDCEFCGKSKIINKITKINNMDYLLCDKCIKEYQKNKKPCLCGCDECQGDGIWKVYIRKQFHGEYGKSCGLYCTFCLEEELQGIHSGGGLTAFCIKKIVRKVNI